MMRTIQEGEDQQPHGSGDDQASLKRNYLASPVIHVEQIGVEFGCERDHSCFTRTEPPPLRHW